MGTIFGLLRTCQRHLEWLAGLPAQSLTAFVDDADDVWVTDIFMDQPEPFAGR